MLRSSHILRNASRISTRSKKPQQRNLSRHVKDDKPPPPNHADALQAGVGSVFAKVFGVTAAVGGALCGYALYDDDFREMVEESVPYSAETFQSISQFFNIEQSQKSETTTEAKSEADSDITFKADAKQSSSKKADVPKQHFKQPPDAITTQTAAQQTAVAQVQTQVAPEPESLGSNRWDTSVPSNVPMTKQEKRAEEKRVKEEERKREAEMVRRKMIEKEMEEMAENNSLEEYIKSATERANMFVAVAVDLQKNVIVSTKEHTKKLKEAIDDSVDIMTKDEQWKAVIEAFKHRESKDIEAEQAHKAALDCLQILKDAIEKGKQNQVTRKNSCLLPAQELVTTAKKDLVKAEMDVTKTRNEVKMTINSREMIEKARKQFKMELESITPEIIIGDKHAKKLSEEQLNSLLVHAYRRINQLQKQYANQVEFEMQRSQKALEVQMTVTEEVNAEHAKQLLQVEFEMQRSQKALEEQMTVNEVVNAEHAKQLLQVQRDDFDIERQKAIAETSVQYERQLLQELARQTAAHSEHLKDVLTQQEQYERQHLQELARQTAAHSEHLKDVLTQQEKALEEKAEARLNAALIEERQSFQVETAGWIARLKGVEAAVDGRAEQEKVARAAQDLWLACVTLNGAISRGNPAGETWEDQLLPLAKEIAAVKTHAQGHLFVESILRSLPETAFSRGVWTEDNLLERFQIVRRNCKRVSMIHGDNRSLFRFFMSYLQSYFVFTVARAKTPDDDIDLENLDTFTCLVQAEYWLKQGNLEYALRFMNQLKGESRVVASDWIKETRLLLEMRQASQLLTAYASASGLGTIF